MKRTAILIVATLALLGLPSAASESGREFAGFYETADVVDVGEDVSLTLKLRVFNPEEVDVRGATLWLEDPAIPDSNYGQFGTVDLPARNSIRLVGTFTVPRHEYESWRQGATGGTHSLHRRRRKSGGTLRPGRCRN